MSNEYHGLWDRNRRRNHNPGHCMLNASEAGQSMHVRTWRHANGRTCRRQNKRDAETRQAASSSTKAVGKMIMASARVIQSDRIDLFNRRCSAQAVGHTPLLLRLQGFGNCTGRLACLGVQRSDV